VFAEPLERIVRGLRRGAEAGFLADRSDADLLHRFLTERDAAAFEAIVRRHGPLVLGACRKVLTERADVEDVFQATFLTLLRDARKIRRRQSLGPWLFGVAHRLAARLRRAAARRRRHERGRRTEGRGTPDPSWREACAALHEELAELPDRLRLPLLLCYLEGKTRDEAARELGCSLNTVKKRLELGRGRLRGRLARRGLALSAGLLAALGDSAAASGLPPALLEVTLQAATTGRPSRAVAALLRGVAPAMSPRLKLIAGVVLAAGLLAGALGLRSAATVSATPADPPAGAANDQPKERPLGQPGDESGSATYAGRVLDPDGKPVAGARLYLIYYTPKVLPIPQRGSSDSDGRFRFTVEKKELDRTVSARPWDEAVVFALADGYGLGFPDWSGQVWSPTDLTVRLVKDEPITGRVLDLQGKPVAGATAVVHQLWWPTKGDLSAFFATLKQRRELMPALMEHRLMQTGLWMGRDIGRILPPAVTDADGRFRLTGVGRERVVGLRIAGPTIAATELWAMTRPGETVRLAAHQRGRGDPGTIFAGATFEYLAAPGRPIVGTVRDRDTGRPIPGAVVESYQFAGTNLGGQTHLRAVADREGRYRLLGMPKAEGNQVRVSPPDGKPYLMALARVPDGPGLEPVTVDVRLKRGVWITGKVTDRVTGKPVPSSIQYVPLGDNPNLPDLPGLTFDHDMKTRPEDGSFRFVGLPGRAVVAARAWQPGSYRTRAGAERIKDLDRIFLNMEYHTVAEVNPKPGAESATCDLALVPGVTLTGTVLGPDGKPLAGALVRGAQDQDYWEDRPAEAEFTVLALKPGEPRLLQFTHPEKKLAGSLVVRGDEKGPLTVPLGPAGALTGRFVTTDGKPLADLELIPMTHGPVANPLVREKPDVTAGSFPGGPRTDKAGRFRVEGLAPGLTYRLALRRGMFLLTPEGDVGKGVTVQAGETRDLGEVKIKLPDE
jgi:RNA polymerase sigma factor (sigma-70 family)